MHSMKARIAVLLAVPTVLSILVIAAENEAWAVPQTEVGIEAVGVRATSAALPAFTGDKAHAVLSPLVPEIEKCLAGQHQFEGEAKTSIDVNSEGAPVEIRVDSELPEHAIDCVKKSIAKMHAPAAAAPEIVTTIEATFVMKPRFDVFEYVSTVTNFIIMFGFLAYVLKRPLTLFLEARRENMAEALREAKAKQAEAEKRLDEYGHKLDHLEEEVARIVTAYEKEAEADRERLKQDADRAIDRLVRETEFTIRQEARKAEKAIREAAVQATLETAEEIVKARITEADHRRLADTYIASLGQKN
jgi:F0F1-type ATP synthase membrane subunit b/b'